MAIVKGVWVFNETLDIEENQSIWVGDCSFTFCGENYVGLEIWDVGGEGYVDFYTDTNAGDMITPYCGEWQDDYNNRTIDFGSTPQEVPDDFYMWLTANAVQQANAAELTIAEKLVLIAENVQKVYDAGKAAGGGVDAGIDLFWETYQQGGARTEYRDKFNYGSWTNETFRPKYPIYMAGDCTDAFRETAITNYDVLKMVDFSKVNVFNWMFRSCKCTHLGVIDTRGQSSYLYEMFYSAQLLETIDKIILKDDGDQQFLTTFAGTRKLTTITFEGVIGQNINFDQSSNLTHDSLMNIIEHLKDYSGTTTTKTLTLHADAKARLTDEEKAIATQKGWTIA